MLLLAKGGRVYRCCFLGKGLLSGQGDRDIVEVLLLGKVLLLRKVVEYIVELLLEGKVVEYIVEVLLSGKVVEYIGAAFQERCSFQERWSSI